MFINNTVQNYLYVFGDEFILTGCTFSDIILTNNLNFVEFDSTHQNPIITYQSNIFNYNTITANVSGQISFFIFAIPEKYNVTFEDNQISCNHYLRNSTPVPLPMFSDGELLSLNALRNTIDVRCPLDVCFAGYEPNADHLRCSFCPQNTISPNGTVCTPCPAGSVNDADAITCISAVGTCSFFLDDPPQCGKISAGGIAIISVVSVLIIVIIIVVSVKCRGEGGPASDKLIKRT